MRKLRNKYTIVKVFLTIFYSTIYAIGLQIFIQPVDLLTTGLAGIAQIIEQLSPIIPFGILYLIVNIPGIVIGYIFLGKKFTFYSLLSIVSVTLVTLIIPAKAVSSDLLLNSIFGGILMGYGIGSLLKIGGSSGGTDFFAMYLLKYKNVEFSKVNIIINTIIVLLGILFNNIEIGMYTIVSLYIRNTVLEQVFTNTQTTTLFIVGKNLTKPSEYINNTLKRGTTIIKNVEGGYTHHKKELIMTSLNRYEYSVFIDYINSLEEEVFITVMDAQNIVGNYKLSKGEIDESK